MLEVSLHLLCSKKSGTLSRIIREINLFGLQYRNHKIKFDKDRTQIIVNATGNLNCTPQTLEELFASLPEVIKVQTLKLTENGKPVDSLNTKTSDAHIKAGERLTPAIILAAEKRLSEVLGPVASFFVETAAQNTANAGELFNSLAEELNGEKERRKFLSIIERDGKR